MLDHPGSECSLATFVMAGQNRLDAALALVLQGWPIFPCDPATKAPLVVGGFKAATTDERKIRARWERWPQAMIGVPTGQACGFWALDLDLRADGRDGIAQMTLMEDSHGTLPRGPVALTPSGGRHHFFRYDADRPITNRSGRLPFGIDVRGNGGYICVAPSVRADGAAYCWEVSPDDVNFPDAPDWLIDLLASPPSNICNTEVTPETGAALDSVPAMGLDNPRLQAWVESAFRQEIKALAHCIEGRRNEQLNRSAFAIYQLVASGWIKDDEAHTALLDAAAACGVLKDDGRKRVLATIASGKHAGLASPRAVPEEFVRDAQDPAQGADIALRLLAGTHASALNQGSHAIEAPLPLAPPTRLGKRYPIDALGTTLAPAARAIASMVQVPLGIAGQSVLAVGSLCAQPHADVLMPFGQTRPLSLFCLTIAASGDRKSSADKEALRPVAARENELRAIHNEELQRWNADWAAWNAQKKQIERSKTSLDEKTDQLTTIGPEPPKPLHPMLTVGNFTVDGLLKNWGHCQGALGAFTAEGGQFTGGHAMNSDNIVNSGAVLNQLWDGDPINRMRSGDGVSELLGRRLALHVMLQPEAATDFLGNRTLRDLGTLARLLVAAPVSIAGTRFYRDPLPDERETLRIYTAQMLGLLRCPYPKLGLSSNELAPRKLSISVDAMDRWRAFYDEVERQLGRVEGAEEGLGAINGVAAKAAENAARIAGILTIVEDVRAGEISASTMTNAVVLMRWYLDEALRLHGVAKADPQLELARNIHRFALNAPDQQVTLRDIMNKGPSATRVKRAAEPAIKTLLEHRLIVEVRPRPLTYKAIPEPLYDNV